MLYKMKLINKKEDEYICFTSEQKITKGEMIGIDGMLYSVSSVINEVKDGKVISIKLGTMKYGG